MSLLDDIASSTQTPGSRCTVPAILTSLPAADAEDLQAALDDPALQGSAIARALSKRGVRVSATTIQRHRRRECKCP